MQKANQSKRKTGGPVLGDFPPSNFGFFGVFSSARRNKHAGNFTCSDPVSHINAARGERIEMVAVMRAWVEPSIGGRLLHMTAWTLGKDRERIPLANDLFCARPFRLDVAFGAFTCFDKLSLEPEFTGIHGIELVDSEGAFSPAGTVLATHMLWIEVADGPT